MLKTLRLQHFQSHTDSIIEFDSQFNCITGIGNAGKSSIVRALNFLLYNQWDKSWVTFEAPYCTVTATLVDKTVLTRKKGVKMNEYHILYPSGTFQKFENFGTEIPQEIQNVTKIFPVLLPGGEEIKLNLHSQFDQPFISSVTSANKAKLFGKLSGLDILDAINQEVNLTKKQNQATTKIKEDELKEVLEKLLTFAKLPEARLALINSKTQLDMIQNQVEKLQELQNLKTKVLAWKQKYSSTTTQLNKCKFVDQIDTEVLDKRVQGLAQCYHLKDRIQAWKTRQIQLKQRMQVLEEELSLAKDTYLNTLKNSGVCPTCLNPVTEKCLQEVIQDL